jgi:hypothetical protein
VGDKTRDRFFGKGTDLEVNLASAHAKKAEEKLNALLADKPNIFLSVNHLD